MNKLNFKLKLNKIFERNFKIRKKMLDVERLTKEIKEIQDENNSIVAAADNMQSVLATGLF